MTEDELIDGFGERLRLERERLSLTQEELANLVGVKQQTIYQYEKGRTFPTLPFLYSLRKLGFNTHYLFSGGELNVPKPNDIPQEVFQVVADMIAKIEKEFCKGPLSDETKLRMLLILLGQYAEAPSSLPMTEAQYIEFLVNR